MRTLQFPLLISCVLAICTTAFAADAPCMAEAERVGRLAASWSVDNQMDKLSYENMCTAYGILKIARATGDEQLRGKIEAAFRPYLLEGKSPNRDNATVPQHQWFALVPLELFRQTPRREYLERGIELAERQYARPDERGMPSYTPRWFVDDIYGATAMQSLAYTATGEKKYLDRAVKQVLVYADKFQQDNGLFYHGPASPYFWGRGNGWCAAAIAELLDVLPDSHPKRDAVLKVYRRMMTGLLEHQTGQGTWRQLIDRESWDETSCTGMFLFALSEGVANGWLTEQRYRDAVQKGCSALARYVDEQGRLREVCVGTGHGKSLEHYLARPRKTGDAHGQAGLLWAMASIVEAGRTD